MLGTLIGNTFFLICHRETQVSNYIPLIYDWTFLYWGARKHKGMAFIRRVGTDQGLEAFSSISVLTVSLSTRKYRRRDCQNLLLRENIPRCVHHLLATACFGDIARF